MSKVSIRLVAWYIQIHSLQRCIIKLDGSSNRAYATSQRSAKSYEKLLTEDNSEQSVLFSVHASGSLKAKEIHRSETRLVTLLNTITPPHLDVSSIYEQEVSPMV